MVNADAGQEDSDLEDALDALGKPDSNDPEKIIRPDAVTVAELAAKAPGAAVAHDAIDPRGPAKDPVGDPRVQNRARPPTVNYDDWAMHTNRARPAQQANVTAQRAFSAARRTGPPARSFRISSHSRHLAWSVAERRPSMEGLAKLLLQ
jgi:hypothetical protein